MIPTYTFFAVDKGNMTLIQFTNGINMMVDCRSSSNRPTPLTYLKQKIKKLDFVVITHPHQDHLTGLKEVCEYFEPPELWHNGRYFRPDPVYEDWEYYEKLRNGKISYCNPTQVQSGNTATIGRSKITLAGPLHPNLENTTDDENNNGIILSVVTGKSKVVLTGDAQEEYWEKADLNKLANASIFLASHHGRENGYSDKAMDVIAPQHIIISDGKPGDTDATSKYKKIAPVSTTREKSITIRPKQESASSVAR